MTSHGAVVVGVDGSEASRRAVQWAAEEAGLRRVALRLVHAIDPRDDADFIGGECSSPTVLDLLADARAIAEAAISGLDVIAEPVVGSPVEALVGRQATPAVVCVGSSGEAPARPGHRASLITELLLAAPCAVTVVRDRWSPNGSVVTEIGCGSTATELLRAAVSEAVLRSAPLRVLTTALQGSCTREEVRAGIVAEVDRYRDSLPDLDVSVLPIAWTPATYLPRYKRNIGLFLAPSRLTHDVGTVLHPEAAQALELLDCPVMFNADVRHRTNSVELQVEREMSS